MSKEDSIEVTGTVVEKFPAGLFSVQLDQDRTVLAHLAGKLRRNRIRVLAGDRVTLATVALALILGGALGNVHDRIVYGFVVDFIEVHIFSYHWPDFNLADSSIVTGACLLFLDSLLPRRKSIS